MRYAWGASEENHVQVTQGTFIPDSYDKKKIKIDYCPTHVILAYFSTKPLQRQLFKRFRYLIMGYTSIVYFIGNMYPPIKECVGDMIQNEVIGDSI